MTDMGHQGQVHGVRRLERQFQSPEAEVAGDEAADANLHADNAVAISFDLFDATVHRQHGGCGGFANLHVLVETKNTGERDVEEGENAVGRVRHHVVAKAVVVARAGAARIDHCRESRASRDHPGIDAEGGGLVIDVGVDVDEAGRDNAT
jgi:hypothetical protein